MQTELELLARALEAFYESFYKLASITFAWNASLTAFAGAILINSEKLSGMLVLYSTAIIGVIATLYNLSAIFVHKQIAKASGEALTRVRDICIEDGIQGLADVIGGSKKNSRLVRAALNTVLSFLVLAWLAFTMFTLF